MEISLNVVFWGFVMAYCIHVVEEVAVGEGFVEMMRRTFYPAYSGRMFVGFNLMIFVTFVMGIVVFEGFGGVWVIWPLSFAFMFVTNGLWHLLQTIVLRKFSPGLITSPLYWILLYFVTRYFLFAGDILLIDFVVSAVIGTVMTLVIFGLAFRFRRKMKR
ncbi:MAG: HXXEE domain-containing protein [Candidatus Hodarchaeota archaeon]